MTIFRAAFPSDRPFIVSGWSSSYRMSRDETRPMELYAPQMHAEVNHYLDRPGVSTLVAEGNVLQGFIVYEPAFVYYVYVAQPFRRMGIASGLLLAAGIDTSDRFGYAYRTKASWEILKLGGKCPYAQHDPYRIRFPPEDKKEPHVEYRR